MRPSTFRRLMNLWPPFLFNSIRVQHVSEDWSELRVVLREEIIPLDGPR